MLSAKRQFGDLGEKAAAKYLRSLGYEIIAINFENDTGRKLGEIDIIARDKSILVFVEVKTRELGKYQNTLPEENITRKKLRNMEKTANLYLRQNKFFHLDYRFDAVSVWLDATNQKAKIKHISHL
jgi:putative endonuclease